MGGTIDIDAPSGTPVPRAGGTEKVPVTTSMMAHAGTNKKKRGERGIGGFLDLNDERRAFDLCVHALVLLLSTAHTVELVAVPRVRRRRLMNDST
jgi:hypothetical protein